MSNFAVWKGQTPVKFTVTFCCEHNRPNTRKRGYILCSGEGRFTSHSLVATFVKSLFLLFGAEVMFSNDGNENKQQKIMQ